MRPADQGVCTFSATLKTAAAAGMMGGQTNILVYPAAATRLVISALTTIKANTAFSITVTAYDAYGNVATDCAGTLHFSSSDKTAVLPADYTFTSSDRGVHTFTGLKLKVKGNKPSRLATRCSRRCR